MPELIKVPKIGTFKIGTITEWLVHEGEAIQKDDPIVEVTFGKTVQVIESPIDGVLLKQLADNDSKLEVDTPIGIIGQKDESITELLEKIEQSSEKELSKDKPKIVVIGGGPGGYVAAIRAAQLGGDVTLIEKHKLGGTCLNVGCIPTKTLLKASQLYSTAYDAADFGIYFSQPSFDMQKMQDKKQEVVDQLVEGIDVLMNQHNINVIYGTGSFIDGNTLKVQSENTEQILKYDRAIVATGSKPALPPIEDLSFGSRVIDSTQALALNEVPDHLIILGGGVIGCEMADIYRRFGSRVTIIESQSHLLPWHDHDIQSYAQNYFSDQGVEIYTDFLAKKIKNKSDKIQVTIESDDTKQKIVGDYLLIATGRKPMIESLNLEAVNIQLNNQGYIQVDESQRTSQKNIFAIGDVADKLMLAHVASAQGEVAAEVAMGQSTTYSPIAVPAGIYTHLEMASIGLTENQATEEKLDFEVAVFPLLGNGKSIIENNGEGFVKIISDKQHSIIGAHIVGPRATDLISELALAMEKKLTVQDIVDVIHGHPTINESIREASLALLNRPLHL